MHGLAASQHLTSKVFQLTCTWGTSHRASGDEGEVADGVVFNPIEVNSPAASLGDVHVTAGDASVGSPVDECGPLAG